MLRGFDRWRFVHQQPPGNLIDLKHARMCRTLQITTAAHHILIVEKEAVFRALCEARLWDMMPLVLVTGQGMPDIATRMMIYQITHASAPSLPLSVGAGAPRRTPGPMCVMGLVDWNPSGCYILCNYKFGNKKATKQSTSYVSAHVLRSSSNWCFLLHSIAWLGTVADAIRGCKPEIASSGLANTHS
jgi:hypothetical protein